MRLPELASRGRGRAHRVFHPLSGADPATLLRVLAGSGGVAPGRAHVAAVALGMALLRLPFTLAEQAALELMLRRGRALPAPVFIIGHWRSGTTHLANMLSRSLEFGILPPISVGLPWEALGLARVAGPFIEQFFPRTRLIDDIALAPHLPQEDELALANMSALSPIHGLYFPRRLRHHFDRGVFFDGVGAGDIRSWSRVLRRYVAKMTLQQGGRPLLIRNPVNAARIPQLRAIWPDARFIHIHRNPHTVQASSRRMFALLVRELSLQEAQADVAALVRHVYPRLMTRLVTDSAALPPGSFTEIRYERFREAPVAELERVHIELGLPGFTEARASFQGYAESVSGHRPAQHRIDAAQLAWTREHCAPFLARWNYQPP